MTGLRIIGMGCEDRRDDAVGICAIRMLQEMKESGAWRGGADLVAAGDDATLIAATLVEGRRVLVVDAVEMGCAPGAVRLFSTREACAGGPRFSPGSTHELTVAGAAALADALGYGGALRILGIQAADMRPGRGLSPSVSACLPSVVASLRAEAEGVL